MIIKLNGHKDYNSLHSGHNAVSLTPDILRVLEETREGAMEELEKVGDYSNEIIVETRNEAEKYGFEGENFKLDSSRWEIYRKLNGRMLVYNQHAITVNPEGDIFEITLENGTKEQLFTQVAALRETQKASKAIPTANELLFLIHLMRNENIEKGNSQIDLNICKALCLNLSGSLDIGNETLTALGMYGFCWSSTAGTCLWINYDSIDPAAKKDPLNALPVRCFK